MCRNSEFCFKLRCEILKVQFQIFKGISIILFTLAWVFFQLRSIGQQSMTQATIQTKSSKEVISMERYFLNTTCHALPLSYLRSHSLPSLLLFPFSCEAVLGSPQTFFHSCHAQSNALFMKRMNSSGFLPVFFRSSARESKCRAPTGFIGVSGRGHVTAVAPAAAGQEDPTHTDRMIMRMKICKVAGQQSCCYCCRFPERFKQQQQLLTKAKDKTRGSFHLLCELGENFAENFLV